MKPECEKKWLEKRWDNLKSATEWCKENWESLVNVVCTLVIVAGIAALAVVTFGAAVVLIAAAVGAAIGLVGQFASDCIISLISGTWGLSSWQTYLGSVLGSTVGGLLFMLTGGNPVVICMASAAVSTFFGQNLENITNGEKRSSVEILLNTGLSMVIAALISKIPIKIKGINSGRGNYDSVFRGVMTKLGRNIIRNVSGKTIVKGIVAGLTDDFWQIVIDGAIDGFRKRFFMPAFAGT